METISAQLQEETTGEGIRKPAAADQMLNSTSEPSRDTQVAQAMSTLEITQPRLEAPTELKEAEKSARTPLMKIPTQNLPVRAYLDQTVVPLLVQGLGALAKERPGNPIEFLAAFLLKNNPQKRQL
eukprot:EC124643.1.p1 GENE.EC124643.1~~EC124643.1.p1  ORF type:complete len:126 (+),score=13.83 EC124643.1:297-674(+)